MMNTTRALALPAALLLALGLAACGEEVPVSGGSQSSGPDTSQSAGPDDRGSDDSGNDDKNDDNSSGGADTSSETINVLDLQVGDCFSAPEGATTIQEVELIDCNTPHDYEAYNNHQITQSTYPTSSEMDTIIQEACLGSFETYVGTSFENSEYDVTSLNPSESSWEQGDRSITCVIKTMDGSQLTESARGTGK